MYKYTKEQLKCSNVSTYIWLLPPVNHTQWQMGRLVSFFFFSHFLFHLISLQSQMPMFSHRVASQIRVHRNVISPWVAGHIEEGPPSGDREHFISHWHVHLYPHHPAEGCWGCQPWGKKKRKKKELELLPESKKCENPIRDHRAKLGTKSLGSVEKVIHVLYFNVPILSLSLRDRK